MYVFNKFKMNSSKRIIITIGLLPILFFGQVNQITYGLENQNDEHKYVQDEIIVKYKSTANEKSVSTLNSELDLSTKQDLPFAENTKLVTIPENEKVEDIVDQLEDSKLIEWVQPNYIYSSSSTPSDPFWTKQWGAHNTGQTVGNSAGLPDVDIDALEAFGKHPSTNTVVVAVIDTGIDTNHPDLSGRIWENIAEKNGVAGVDDDKNGFIDDINGWDFYNNDRTLFDSIKDDSHGTHVAGIIASLPNNIGVRGIASNVKIMPIKFVGPNGGTTIDAISAIEYATAMGAKVINASWGGNSGMYDNALNDAIATSGTVFVAAAGNGGDDGVGDNNDITPMPPASLSASNIISVAAINNKGKLASFSNYGLKTVDVGAPGVDIISTLPNNQYGYMSGTSMATPFVTAIAASLFEVENKFSTTEVVNIIKNSGTPLTELANKTATGKLVNLNEALENILPVKGYIDYPQNSSTVTGTIKVSGWLLDNRGVEKIEILIDDILAGAATYGYQRTDVLKAFPEYSNGYSGYEYLLNTSKLSPGMHNVTVLATSSTGEKKNLGTRSINIVNLPPKGYYDTPNAGTTTSGDMLVKGWFLDSAGVKSIEVLVNGKVSGVAQYNLKREDVYSAFPEYNNLNSGYQYILDTSNLPVGSHTFSVRAISANGTITSLPPRQFYVGALPSKGYIDKPSEGQTVKGSIFVNGWFLSGKGVKSIEVLVDDKVHGQATYGLKRDDVFAAFPEYKNPNSGYEYLLDTTTLTPGSHKVSVRETSITGVQTTLVSKKINIDRTDAFKSYLDSPNVSETLHDSFKVKGWYLDSLGVNKVEVLLNGVIHGQAAYGIKRTDVYSAFPEFNNQSSGFDYTVNTDTIKNGSYTLSIRGTTKTGIQRILGSRTIKIENLLPPRGYLDTPSNLASLSGAVKVSGWFLDRNGVNKIEVLVDGKVVGQANYGYKRLDVSSFFPGYKNDYSGYEFMLDTSLLTEGNHTLSIKETSESGLQTNLQSITISILK